MVDRGVRLCSGGGHTPSRGSSGGSESRQHSVSEISEISEISAVRNTSVDITQIMVHDGNSN